jgi:hypothetical protein
VGATPGTPSSSTEQQEPQQQEQQEWQQERQQYDQLVSELASLARQRMTWFRSHQFEQVAVGLSACGLRGVGFWNAFVREMERKLMAFTAGQLANVAASLAAAGFVPSRNWLERTERQAYKHLHRATAGGRRGRRTTVATPVMHY